MTEKIERLADLVRKAGTTSHPDAGAAGRSAFTQRVDEFLLWMRKHAPAVHWLGAGSFGLALYVYAWIAGKTARLSSVGERGWPDVPARCVLAIWHDSAPSMLAAIAKAKPPVRLAIMVSTEPRGDSLQVLCRLLGLEVIRGDWEHHGWQSVVRLVRLAEEGACIVITPDGGGPRRMARAGALVLSAAAGVPLVVMGADCHPALREPNKWDQPRNPVLFCRIAIAMEQPLRFGDFEDAAAMEAARLQLERDLSDAASKASQTLALS
jgi:lysophospholipid acyltransferase (LPLAT)-like uncharacterized protein